MASGGRSKAQLVEQLRKLQDRQQTEDNIQRIVQVGELSCRPDYGRCTPCVSSGNGHIPYQGASLRKQRGRFARRECGWGGCGRWAFPRSERAAQSEQQRKAGDVTHRNTVLRWFFELSTDAKAEIFAVATEPDWIGLVLVRAMCAAACLDRRLRFLSRHPSRGSTIERMWLGEVCVSRPLFAQQDMNARSHTKHVFFVDHDAVSCLACSPFSVRQCGLFIAQSPCISTRTHQRSGEERSIGAHI